LNQLVGGRLTVIYYRDVVPERVATKARHVLGRNAVPLHGEWRLAGRRRLGGEMANSRIRIPFQPGLVRAALASRPQVVVSDGFFQWTYAALWLRATKNIPHVMCYERTAHTERKAQWYRTAYRKTALRWIDAICCNGSLCGAYTQSLDFPADRITYGHMVADVGGFQRRVAAVSGKQVSQIVEEHALKGVVFLYVGRLVPPKGVKELLIAWRRLSTCSLDPEATLLLVGDGPQRPELEHYAKENELHNVQFAGLVEHDSLAPYYACADVFAIPTLEDNWSLAVPEAMACGLPILCSKYNGCWPEYVMPSNGWVFDPLDLDNAVDHLQKCLLAKDVLSKMGEKSLAIVNEHTAEHAARTILETCEIALSK
jgi:glycosyltransferase involved in cell wall biosynthesis